MPSKGFHNILLLQGGGALGAYHLGVYEELERSGIAPDWVAGVSIGALNAALIAGNPPEKRLDALKTFWRKVSGWYFPKILAPVVVPVSGMWSGAMAMWSALSGVPGVFRPWALPYFLQPEGSAAAVSAYDTGPLRKTLEKMIDFDRLNDGPVRVSVGAVGVTSGEMRFFDNEGGPDKTRITVDHILASGALPPGFPPVRIDDEWYWDGGVASNSALQHVLDARGACDANIFQVDLFSTEGEFPKNMFEAHQRAEEIRYASRTSVATGHKIALSEVRQAVRQLLVGHDPGNDTDLSFMSRALLDSFACEPCIEIAQIVYREKNLNDQLMMADLSPAALLRHRRAGAQDAAAILSCRDWTQPPMQQGVHITDPAAEGVAERRLCG